MAATTTSSQETTVPPTPTSTSQEITVPPKPTSTSQKTTEAPPTPTPQATPEATAPYGPTCDALDLVTDHARFMECTRNDRCDTVNCTVTLSPFDGTLLSLTILPCRNPPGVHVVVRDPDSDETILDNVYDHTVTGIGLGSGASLAITVNQLNITLIGIEAAVKLRLRFGVEVTRELLEYTAIPLNKASCTSPVLPTAQETSLSSTLMRTSQTITETVTPTTQVTLLTMTPTKQDITESMTPTSQEALTPITQEVTSTPTQETSTIPPTTQEITKTSTQETTVTPTPTTQETTMTSTSTAQETTMTSTSTAQETTMTSTSTAQETTMTPTPTTQETTMTPTPTTQEITETPTPTIQKTPTLTTQGITETPKPTKTPTASPPAKNRTACDILAELAKSSEAFQCVADTEEPCDRLDCAAELFGLKFTAEVVLLPCHSPPAVHITMSRGGKEALNKTVDRSQEIVIPDLFNLKLNITLDHFKDAIGLQVDAETPVQIVGSIRVLKYTVIPMERYNCDAQDSQSSKNGVLETTSAILILISLLTFATGMV